MASKPVIVTTWRFGVAAAEKGYSALASGANALDAIEQAANVTGNYYDSPHDSKDDK